MQVKQHTLWLYRSFYNDPQGDPLDFGAVRAHSRLDAWERVRERFKSLGITTAFYLYPTTDATAGVLPDDAKRGRRSRHLVNRF